MSTSSFLRALSVFCTISLIGSLLGGCGSLNMRCDGGGKGYSCNMVDGPPERHTRTTYQPAWSDEYHDLASRRQDVNAYVFKMTNETREERGRLAVKEDETLTQNACWHNQDMIAHEYFAHTDSDDREPWDRVHREHRRLIGEVSENTYSGVPVSDQPVEAFAEKIMTAWMNSPGHRDNLLTAKWTHLGVCVSEDTTESRATQVFARVQAYLDEPLPWTMAPGASQTVSISLVAANRQPERYAFIPPNQSVHPEFNRVSKPFDGHLTVPSEPGKYNLHVMIPDDDGRPRTFVGPRVWVKPEDEPAY